MSSVRRCQQQLLLICVALRSRCRQRCRMQQQQQQQCRASAAEGARTYQQNPVCVQWRGQGCVWHASCGRAVRVGAVHLSATIKAPCSNSTNAPSWLSQLGFRDPRAVDGCCCLWLQERHPWRAGRAAWGPSWWALLPAQGRRSKGCASVAGIHLQGQE